MVPRISITFALLSCALGAFAQESTASLIIGIVDSTTSRNELGFSGQVVGTGTDGTTYVASAVQTVDVGSSEVTETVTMTAVQEATHVSLILAEENDAYTAIEGLVCDFESSGSAVCTEALYAAAAAGTVTTTAVASGSAYVLALPIQDSTATSIPTSSQISNAESSPSDDLVRATSTSTSTDQASASQSLRTSSCLMLFSATLAGLYWVVMFSL